MAGDKSPIIGSGAEPPRTTAYELLANYLRHYLTKTPEAGDGFVALLDEVVKEARAGVSSDPVVEYGFCGSLDWTVKQWGRITHKHSCPNRTDPFCQTHPAGCPIDLSLADVAVLSHERDHE